MSERGREGGRERGGEGRKEDSFTSNGCSKVRADSDGTSSC